VVAQGLGHFYLVTAEDMDELKRVDGAFAEVVIVGDDESFPGGVGDVADASGPGVEFLAGVEIVVALGRRRIGIVAEPGVVAAAVQANVADRRRDAFAGPDGVADDGLIDIAESDAALVQKVVKGFPGPRGVTDLDDEAVVFEIVEDLSEAREVFGRLMKRKRELQEESAEAVRFVKDVETFADGFDVAGRGAAFVGELLPELGGEKESGIRGDALEPLCGERRLERMVEGRVDLDGVEELREVRRFVKAGRAVWRVHDAVPVRVRPAGGPDQNLVRRRRNEFFASGHAPRMPESAAGNNKGGAIATGRASR